MARYGQGPSTERLANERCGPLAGVKRTLLSLWPPSYDDTRPFLPRGAKCLNGFRQPIRGIKV